MDRVEWNRWAWWLLGVATLVVFVLKPTEVIELVEVLARLLTGLAFVLLLWRSGPEVQQILGRFAKGDRLNTPAGSIGFAEDLTEAKILRQRLAADPDPEVEHEVRHEP